MIRRRSDPLHVCQHLTFSTSVLSVIHISRSDPIRATSKLVPRLCVTSQKSPKRNRLLPLKPHALTSTTSFIFVTTKSPTATWRPLQRIRLAMYAPMSSCQRHSPTRPGRSLKFRKASLWEASVLHNTYCSNWFKYRARDLSCLQSV